MNKRISLLFLTALLAACSSKAPVNLVHTQQPILNMTAEVSPLIEAGTGTDSAWVKNKTGQAFDLAYDLFWYDKNGVTQPFSDSRDAYGAVIRLQPQQKTEIQLSRPTPESVNYRLYLRRR